MECAHEIMKQMTFMVIYEARILTLLRSCLPQRCRVVLTDTKQYSNKRYTRVIKVAF